MAKDPRFVAGIYNYCDRWCERCPLTSRCMVFATTHAESEPEDFAEVARRVEKDLAEAMAMLQEEADRRGIDLTPTDPVAYAAKEQATREAIDGHPLVQAARQYADMAGAWLETHGQPGIASNELADAIAVVEWHQYQVQVKLRRALLYEPVGFDGEDPIQTDANGSARVALLATERSLAAWFQLFHLNRATADIERILDHLKALCDDVDRVFPDARRFIRPGFDTGDEPWPDGQPGEGEKPRRGH